MNFKTITIIIISVLLTIVLMNNREEVYFWFFGDVRASKLLILVLLFVAGFIVGIWVARPIKKIEPTISDEATSLSDADREYIN